jgi:outer membrane protein assembly factor BamB
MGKSWFAPLGMSVVCAVSVMAVHAADPADWSRFRGPNGSGVSAATNLPVEFGPAKDTAPAKNLIWRIDLPQGHSSPMIQGDRIYLTGVTGDQLSTFAIDRHTGKILWQRPAPAPAKPIVDKRNSPASPSPAVEADGVYVFFQDFGLLAYDAAGKERWRAPLGPFNNIYGMGASPVIVGDLVVLSCDQSTGSFVMAVDKRTGRERWRTPRPEARSGHATPIVWRAPDGKDQLLIPGSFLLNAYDAATGKRLWWVRGLSFEIKSTPVVSNNTLFINGYGSTENEPGKKVVVPDAATVFATADANHDGVLQKSEFPKYTAAFWFDACDLDQSGTLSKDEWEYYRAALDSENGMIAIRLGGSGDMTDKAVKWKYHRSVPQLPSPLIYQGVLYMVNEGGIVTTLNPETGEVLKQGRLTGALGAYFASPIAGDGHIYFTSEPGAISVLPPGGDLTAIAVNQLGEECVATPALADGRIYIRSRTGLFAFGR